MPSRENFCVYRVAECTFLVAGTSVLPLGGEQKARKKFSTPSSAKEIAEQIVDVYRAQAAPQRPIEVTIRVHGYNNRRDDFEESILEDSEPQRLNRGADSFRPPGSFYIGYWWQSEGLGSRVSLGDTAQAIYKSPAVGWVLFFLPVLGLLLRFAAHVPPDSLVGWILAPFFRAPTTELLLGAGVILILLRLSTYLRDRYRALHYGVPDFGEFVREVTRNIHDRMKPELASGLASPMVTVNVIGHSMGALVLINAFRVLCDYFSVDEENGTPSKTIGPDGIIGLGKMILCAADIPALMATPDHNNYFLSVLRRFDKLHVLSSDRDVVLKWLSLVANWASEPRYDMAGRKLGNLYLASRRVPWEADAAAPIREWPISRPVCLMFPLYHENPLFSSTPDHAARPQDRRQLFFHDCTLDPSLSGTMPRLLLGLGIVLGIAAALLGAARGIWALFGWQWHWPALALWVIGGFAGLVLLGMLCRPIWPKARDHGIGGFLGMFIDWPALLVFLSFRHGWNPHSGYFAPGSESRHLIASLLHGGESLPPSGGVLRHAEVTIGT
jgi:hypothetical protein